LADPDCISPAADSTCETDHIGVSEGGTRALHGPAVSDAAQPGEDATCAARARLGNAKTLIANELAILYFL
jgi:hypothetical protein